MDENERQTFLWFVRTRMWTDFRAAITKNPGDHECIHPRAPVDLKISQVLQLEGCETWQQQVKSESIVLSVASFVQNIDRLRWIMPFVCNLAGWASEDQYFFLHAVHDIRSDMGDVTPEIAPKVKTRQEDLWIDFVTKTMMEEQEGTDIGLMGNATRSMTTGRLCLENLLNQGISPVYEAIETVFASTVINAWTSFEILCGDIWEACVNARPRLGFIFLNAALDSSDSPEEIERKKNVDIRFPAWMLQQQEFDLNRHMGRALKNQCDFTRRRGARDAFIRIFRDSKDQVRQIFENESLKWLSAIRNVEVHKAGKCDTEFLKSCSTHPILGSIPIGNRIFLEGEIVKTVVSASVQQGKALIQFVDEWLTINQS